MHTRSADPAAIERVAESAGRLERELGKAIIGQQRVIREILIAASADVPLLIADDVVHASQRSSRALAFKAAASGGGMVTTVDELASRLAAVQPRDVEQRTRPMRSPWWIVPFAGLLCAEWALRRRAGRR